MTIVKCSYPNAHHDGGGCSAAHHLEHRAMCSILNFADYVCTGGSSSTRCLNPVSPDDPDKELCGTCLEKRIAELETIITDAINERVRYRMAVK